MDGPGGRSVASSHHLDRPEARTAPASRAAEVDALKQLLVQHDASGGSEALSGSRWLSV